MDGAVAGPLRVAGGGRVVWVTARGSWSLQETTSLGYRRGWGWAFGWSSRASSQGRLCVSRAALLSRVGLGLPWGHPLRPERAWGRQAGARVRGRLPSPGVCLSTPLSLIPVSLSLSLCPCLWYSLLPILPSLSFYPHRFPFEARASPEGLAGTEARGHPAESRPRWVEGAAQARLLSNPRRPQRLGAPSLWAGSPDRLCWAVTPFLPNPHGLAWAWGLDLRTTWTAQPFTPSSEVRGPAGDWSRAPLGHSSLEPPAHHAEGWPGRSRGPCAG